MVQGEIDIHASHMGPWLLGDQEFRYPTANEDDTVPVLAQKVSQFDQDRFRRFHSLSRIIPACHHERLITSSRSALAASSPRPFTPVKSR